MRSSCLMVGKSKSFLLVSHVLPPLLFSHGCLYFSMTPHTLTCWRFSNVLRPRSAAAAAAAGSGTVTALIEVPIKEKTHTNSSSSNLKEVKTLYAPPTPLIIAFPPHPLLRLQLLLLPLLQLLTPPYISLFTAPVESSQAELAHASC